MIEAIRRWFRRRRLRRLGFVVLEWDPAGANDLQEQIEKSIIITDPDVFLSRGTFFEYEEMDRRIPDAPESRSKVVVDVFVEFR
jgi:hypothetical protein